MPGGRGWGARRTERSASPSAAQGQGVTRLEPVLLDRAQPPTGMQEAQPGQVGQFRWQGVQIRSDQCQTVAGRIDGQMRGAESRDRRLRQVGAVVLDARVSGYVGRLFVVLARSTRRSAPRPAPRAAKGGRRGQGPKSAGHLLAAMGRCQTAPAAITSSHSGRPGMKPGRRGGSTSSNSGCAARKRAIVPSFSSGLKVHVE